MGRVLIHSIKTRPTIAAESGATNYVSPTGSDTWANSSNINTPCSIATAMANASAGDVVYFRGGTYDAPAGDAASYHGLFEPANSGTSGNPIVFMNYPGETPVLRANFVTYDNGFVIGTGLQEYITWDGFTLTASNNDVAGFMMGGLFRLDQANLKPGLVMKNLTVLGGSTLIPNTDNYDICRVEGTDGGLIQNCTIANLTTAGYSDDNAALKGYHNYSLIVENNNIYNAPNAFCSKSILKDSIIRNNFFHDCEMGYRQNLITDVNFSCNGNSVYNNVIVNNSQVGILFVADSNNGCLANDLAIYNNTIYGSAAGTLSIHNATLMNIYNNILDASAGQQNFVTARATASINTCDHNQFGTRVFETQVETYEAGQAVYTSLASWQASGELNDATNPGVGSLASNPQYVNASGNLNELADFDLNGASPCIGAGRSGANIGANIAAVGVL